MSGAKFAQDSLKIGGQRTREFHALAVRRMLEGQTTGVQERPFEVCDRTNVAPDATPDATVERVTHDRMPDRAEVHADLMGAARVDGHPDEREWCSDPF